MRAILFGLATGNFASGFAPIFELLLWPGLALLLYATFTQVWLNQLPAAFRDGSFITAALIGNFVVLPVLVLGVLMLVLVLLVPAPTRSSPSRTRPTETFAGPSRSRLDC